LLEKHRIIISDEFIINSKNFVDSKYHYRLMFDSIEHNKRLGIVAEPSSCLIRHLDLDSCYEEYDLNILERLIKHFKNVDPVDVEHLLSYYKKNTRALLIRHIDFDKQKLVKYAYSQIFKEADDLEVRINGLLKSKRPRGEENKESEENSESVSTNKSNVEQKDNSKEYCKIHIEIIGNNVTNVCYKKNSMYDIPDIFNLYGVKDTNLIVLNIPYMQYSSIVYNNKFIRVFAHGSLIELYIWDLTNPVPVNHYTILKSQDKPQIESMRFDHTFSEM